MSLKSLASHPLKLGCCQVCGYLTFSIFGGIWAKEDIEEAFSIYIKLWHKDIRWINLQCKAKPQTSNIINIYKYKSYVYNMFATLCGWLPAVLTDYRTSSLSIIDMIQCINDTWYNLQCSVSVSQWIAKKLKRIRYVDRHIIQFKSFNWNPFFMSF